MIPFDFCLKNLIRFLTLVKLLSSFSVLLEIKMATKVFVSLNKNPFLSLFIDFLGTCFSIGKTGTPPSNFEVSINIKKNVCLSVCAFDLGNS